MAQAGIEREGNSLSQAACRRIAAIRAERRAFECRRAACRAPTASHLRAIDFPYQPEIERRLAALRRGTGRDVAALFAIIAIVTACTMLCVALVVPAALPV